MACSEQSVRIQDLTGSERLPHLQGLQVSPWAQRPAAWMRARNDGFAERLQFVLELEFADNSHSHCCRTAIFSAGGVCFETISAPYNVARFVAVAWYGRCVRAGCTAVGSEKHMEFCFLTLSSFCNIACPPFITNRAFPQAVAQVHLSTWSGAGILVRRLSQSST